nr:isochorismatase family cysteine hydrolase [uncultured Agathobaculum sp.]
MNKTPKLLVVIDYQNDFVTGALGFDGSAAIDDGIARLAQTYLAQGDHVLFTYDTHDDTYLETREGSVLPIPHCNPNEDGWHLYGKTQELCRETSANHQIHNVCKHAFGMPPAEVIKLGSELPDLREILVVGVVTHMCVISNAVLLQAQWPEAQITVDAALCRSYDPVLHEKALDVMEGLQMKVINR